MVGSRYLMDGLGAQTDTPNVSNGAVTVEMSWGEDAGMYLHAGGVKCDPDKPDGCGNHTDALSGCTDAHSDGDEMETAENGTRKVRMHRVNSRT